MILLFLFCILFGLSGGSMIYHTDRYENHIIEKQEKPVQDMFTFTGYDFYTMSDLFTPDAMTNYINWVYLADGVDLYSISSNYTRGFQVEGTMYFNNGTDIKPSNIESDTTRLFTVERIVLEARVRYQQSTNNYTQWFTLSFYSTTNANYRLEVAFYYITNGTLGSTLNWYTGVERINNNGSYSATNSSSMLVVEYQDPFISGWCRSFLPYNVGGTDGYYNGFNVGYQQGSAGGYANGYNDGYNTGYADADGNFNMNPEMLTIFTGILDVALLPVNVFLSILNFEVFGINIAGFVTSLLTVAIVIIIVRFIFGGKSND